MDTRDDSAPLWSLGAAEVGEAGDPLGAVVAQLTRICAVLDAARATGARGRLLSKADGLLLRRELTAAVRAGARHAHLCVLHVREVLRPAIGKLQAARDLAADPDLAPETAHSLQRATFDLEVKVAEVESLVGRIQERGVRLDEIADDYERELNPRAATDGR